MHLPLQRVCILFAIFLAAFGGHAFADTNLARPNFLIIFTDDQGYGDLGCFGSSTIATPRLDKLAAEGMKFTSFYAQPVCGPSRSALLTGRYPRRINQGGWKVPSSEVTVAEVLKSAGYATACIGKWDVSGRKYVEGMVPNDQGFDYYFGTLGANDGGKVALWRNRTKERQTDDMGSLTKLYTDEAIRFLQQHRKEPFFLYLAHNMPHVKLGASEQFKGKSRGGLYADVIEEIDWNVGRVLDALKNFGLDKTTYVLFTSDNGPWLSMGANGGSAGPLRGGKGSSWEGGVRVPCILRGPDVPAGKTCNELLCTLDVLPTFAALAGAAPPHDRVLDGRDQSQIMAGKTDRSARQTYYYYVNDSLHALRREQWKLALPDRKQFFGYAKDQIPLTKPELYDLETDPAEKHDVAAEHPEIVKKLRELAKQVRAEVGDVTDRKPSVP